MAATSCRFGPYTVDFARREIHRGDERLDVPVKVFDCVTYLIEHRDRAVGRDELIAAIWGRADISDNLLAQIVLRARRSFDDDADAQRCIRTITGFGYRWVHEIDVDDASDANEPAEPVEAVVVEPPVPIASPRSARRTPWLVGALVLFVLVGVGSYLALRERPEPPANAPAQNGLAFVLPAIVRDAPDFAWARLGVMDLVAQRLRESGQATVPSDTAVAIAKLAGESPTPAELAELSSATGAQTFYQPDAVRENDTWRVSLRRLGETTTWEATAPDLVQATNAAIQKLMSALDLSPLPYNEGYGPGATLAQQVTAAILQDRIADARALIEAAPADVRDDPRVRLQAASVDFYQSRLPEARAALEKLDAERSSERAPEFNARVLTALATLDERNGDYTSSERRASEAIGLLKGLDVARVGNMLGPALTVRAAARLAQGAYDDASDDFSTARVVLTTTGNLRALALVDSNDALLQMSRDRFREALPRLAKSAEYFRRASSPIRELLNRDLLARCHLMLQDFAAADGEDAKIAALVDRVDDPEVRDEGGWVRAEIAFAFGRMRDAQKHVDGVLANADVPDSLRGPTLLVDSRLALERDDLARAAASAKEALALKWAEERPREFATTWLLLARADRRLAPKASADAAARARAWAAQSIHASAQILADVLDAEQLAADHRDEPARAAFERALGATSTREVPADVVEVTTSYAAWLVAQHDLERALAVLGRNRPWAATNYRVAVAEARLYRALGNEKLWKAALDRAQATAGERTIPPDAATFEPAKTAARATFADRIAAH